MMKSLKRPEWIRRIQISPAEMVKGMTVAVFLAFFFYRSWLAIPPMLFPAGVLIWWEQKCRVRDKNRSLRQQFGECILSVESAVKAGYAAENAFVESMKDMEMMYGAEAEMMKELLLIKGGLLNNLPMERLLYEMGQRSQVEEMIEFAEVFAITKRNGGKLTDIIQLTAQTIHNRMEAEEEIQTLLASKRLEQKVMNLMPFLLVLYIQMTTPGYFDMYFGSFTGTAMMTMFLIWYLAAYGLSEYILWQATG